MKILLHDFNKGISVQKIEDQVWLDNEDQSNMINIVVGDMELCVCIDDLESAVKAFRNSHNLTKPE